MASWRKGLLQNSTARLVHRARCESAAMHCVTPLRAVEGGGGCAGPRPETEATSWHRVGCCAERRCTQPHCDILKNQADCNRSPTTCRWSKESALAWRHIVGWGLVLSAYDPTSDFAGRRHEGLDNFIRMECFIRKSGSHIVSAISSLSTHRVSSFLAHWLFIPSSATSCRPTTSENQ